jgi:hypothetical protein
MESLLEPGAAVDARGYGMTALQWTAWGERKVMVYLIFHHQPDITAPTSPTAIETLPGAIPEEGTKATGEIPWTTVLRLVSLISGPAFVPGLRKRD